MKKLLFILTALLSINIAQAADFVPQEGKQFITVTQPASVDKEVIEFFSFYCPHCANFQMEYKIPQAIQAKMPQGTHFVKYHVNFLGRASEDLTRAWAFAMATNNTELVEDALFEAAQNNRINSMSDIRKIFIDKGITAEQFDNGINSFAVNGLVNKQINALEQYQVKGVPAFFVNGNKQIDMGGFSDSSSVQQFVDNYTATVLYLLNH
ncbi:thiol:disulfide interchange protein [Testudinibacter sp. TR-2022]|uniref:thiol:disulfide interchange protein DsbA n=1 Tax=Testudinibacter sp. TR-2022 TaxID=2585029 RepID=UPI0011188843|nr:DsbA family protein [Testudinibacter sp. TR-2022]TNH01305.1 thiol:disulfide interchange protein [Pasteurellaceae bacterium Phil31]TNH05434.1 thiol:disulfide interchange protein [Testudinibacter sp. TR-2022]TNH09194.1 thiol:disulfide interchange protein [Testudinibacter sp. TR-2022]